MSSRPIAVFFGDSYAMCGRSANLHASQHDRVAYPVYQDLVCDALGMDQLVFGFGGKSWWFSRRMMMEYFKRHSHRIQDVELVVACHTDNGRVNVYDPQHNRYHGSQGDSTVFADGDVFDTAKKYYYSELWDYDFHQWAQQRWFDELLEFFAGKKIINFHCVASSQAYSHALGKTTVEFTSPLIWISVGEFQGTDDEIMHQLWHKGPHHNHMSESNNRNFADLIVETYRNYRPGRRAIDLGAFDIVNPNSCRWPKAGYGTR